LPSTFQHMRTVLTALRNGMFTLEFLPDTLHRPRTWRMPLWWLYLAGGSSLAILSCAMAALIWAGATTLTIADYQRALDSLAEENRRLESITHQQQAKLLEMAREAAVLAERMTELEQLANEIHDLVLFVAHDDPAGTDELSSATGSIDVETALDTSYRASLQLSEGIAARGVGGGDLYPSDLSTQLHGSLTALRWAVESQSDRLTALKTSAEAYRHKLRHTPNAWPVIGRVTSEYGWRRHPTRGVYQLHAGIDIAVPTGTPVRATAAGRVIHAGPNGGYGLTVVIDHGYGLQTLYAHNARVLVQAGEKVERGDVLALSGSTGVSTGPHVHYEVHVDGRPVNPREFLP